MSAHNPVLSLKWAGRRWWRGEGVLSAGAIILESLVREEGMRRKYREISTGETTETVSA